MHEFKDFGEFRNESQCYAVLRAILHALRDKLPPELSVSLASQLPLILKGVYYDGWNPTRPQNTTRGFDEFIQPLAEELAAVDVDDAQDAIRAAIQL
ncbi:DUF2267 domain-containing protein [Legionella jordanis]|uniref:DUF2267 domain-containing protein n=1 Tax=Legionella jordanis TaxID=456 RepID=A0A0W0V9E8_9GAMM|nr:DUF2267 domain-containing protein [Legionella jordanis]KTD16773.1 hypothetical protein Ljor_1079 [Legionella jordanis]RMX03699.1 DUF2267 domain-containing protein [Legionella jordanis]RMX22239.1 DUF2267 domain-containing protein [Legionella jordanis]VEH11759.1 Uncharacterized conserved protein (DUF2267) [Legionella jordanis]